MKSISKKFRKPLLKLNIFLINDTEVKETLFSSNTRFFVFFRWMNLFFSFVALVPVIASIVNFNLPHFLGYLLSFLLIDFIWVFEWVTKSTIFEEIRFFSIMQITLHSFFGVWLRFYDNYPIFDDILHITGGMWLVSFLFPLVLGSELVWSRNISRTLLFKIFIYMFSIVAMMGVFWEIGEFASDLIFSGYEGYRFAQEGLIDTMSDLIENQIGAVIGLFLFWKTLNKLNKNRDIYNLLEKISLALRRFFQQ
ncbi:hypothetical protein E4650_00140 [Geotoga petraea]|uniref:DUF2238 domain-containing protein n=1 Tax=Geotoga petraea TaxID=28234 RepID=A0A4Z0W7T1_9BACT|nr:hypothetical protein E4650_00140 [Geotoga petraea]